MKTTAAVLRAVTETRPYTASRPLQLEELELGAPRAGELLVRVEAASVCHSDVSVVDGSRVRPLPMALGHEAAGVVEEVGPGVRDVKPGDHVVLTFVPSCGTCPECSSGRPALCTPGAAANGAGHPAARPLPAPRPATARRSTTTSASPASPATRWWRASRRWSSPPTSRSSTAALFGCAVLTGAGAVLNTAAVRPGQSVAVFGLGGVGLASVMAGQRGRRGHHRGGRPGGGQAAPGPGARRHARLRAGGGGGRGQGPDRRRRRGDLRGGRRPGGARGGLHGRRAAGAPPWPWGCRTRPGP